MVGQSWFIFSENNIVLLKENDQYHFPDKNFSQQLSPHFLRHVYLGQLNNQDCYCAEMQNSAVSLPLQLIPLRQTFDLLDQTWYSIIVKAYAIINWDKNHQYCGRCGEQTEHDKPQLFERVCPHCGLAVYPRISPSVIVLIKKGNELLMARSPHFPPNRYGLIAGFVEVGENLEETVHREVKEEVGITIKNLTYFGSQPWPFPDSLMVGFIADYASGELKIDKFEIEDAGWYRYDALPNHPPVKISLAGKLIHHFVTQQENIKKI